MDEQTNLAPRDIRANGGAPAEALASRAPFLTLDMMPREPHLLDYLMILRKHQWLIASFLLAVVTIVTIATFRMQPVYDATTRIEIDRENTSILPFNGQEGYDSEMMDLDNYIETQSKILTSETLGMNTIKSLHLDRDPRFGGSPAGPSTLEVTRPMDSPQARPPALGAFWVVLRSSVSRTAACWMSRSLPPIRNSPQKSSMRISPISSSRTFEAVTKLLRRLPTGWLRSSMN